jgi:hypothetical protein
MNEKAQVWRRLHAIWKRKSRVYVGKWAFFVEKLRAICAKEGFSWKGADLLRKTKPKVETTTTPPVGDMTTIEPDYTGDAVDPWDW